MTFPPARRSATGSSRRWHGKGPWLRVGVLSIALSACIGNRHREPILPLQSPARDTLLLADLHRTDTLVVRGMVAAISAHLAPDVVYLRPGAPAVFGRANVLSLLEANGGPALATAWQPVGGGLSRDGFSGYTFGIAVHSPVEQRPPGIDRYIAFWTRSRGTPWRIAAYAEVGAASLPTTVQPTAGTTVPTPSAGRQSPAATSIIRADSDFAENSSLFGPASAFADAAAPDGVVFGGPQILVGPRAIREFLDQERERSLIWRPTFAAAPSSDLGFSIGESISTSRGPSGAAVQRFGKYLTVWRKQPNGDWKFVIDGGSSRPSPVGQ